MSVLKASTEGSDFIDSVLHNTQADDPNARTHGTPLPPRYNDSNEVKSKRCVLHLLYFIYINVDNTNSLTMLLLLFSNI